MTRVPLAVILLACIGVGACAPSQVFSPQVMEGVDPNFDFSRWRTLPNQAEGRKVHLGGRIVQSEAMDGNVTIVVAHLPIVEHPAYGPKDTGKRSGEFAIVYHGKVESSFLQTGNRVLVVGKTRFVKVVSVDDIPRSLPVVQAECLHIWKTGGREIAEFPSYGAGYEPLEEETMCVAIQ